MLFTCFVIVAVVEIGFRFQALRWAVQMPNRPALPNVGVREVLDMANEHAKQHFVNSSEPPRRGPCSWECRWTRAGWTPAMGLPGGYRGLEADEKVFVQKPQIPRIDGWAYVLSKDGAGWAPYSCLHPVPST